MPNKSSSRKEDETLGETVNGWKEREKEGKERRERRERREKKRKERKGKERKRKGKKRGEEENRVSQLKLCLFYEHLAIKGETSCGVGLAHLGHKLAENLHADDSVLHCALGESIRKKMLRKKLRNG